MELRQLRAFVAVASAGSVTGAASLLELSPGTVSEHVRSLESSLGVVLFERKPTGMVLAERGRLLLPEARRLLDQAESIRRLVSDERTRFTVGALETLVATRLPAVVARLGDRRPDVDLAVRSLMRQPLPRAVADGSLDAGLLLDTGTALGALGFDGGDLSFVDIETGCTWSPAPGTTATPCWSRRTGARSGLAADRLLGTGGRRLEFDSVSTIRSWVAQGTGVALLPDFAVGGDLADGTLVAQPLAERTELALRVVWRTDREDDLREVLYAMAA